MYRPKLLLICLTIFAVSCGSDGGPAATDPDPEPEPSTGAIEVTTNTTGNDIDEDGYTVATGSQSKSINPSGTVILKGLSEGNTNVELSGIASNCSVNGNNPSTVSVVLGDTTTTSFDVACKAAIKNQIVFSSDRNGNLDLYLMNADGSTPQKLTSGSTSKNTPAVSPNGTRIAYSSYNGNDYQVHLMNADGSGDQALTSGSEGMTSAGGSLGPTNPSWSPDGTKLAFRSNRDGNIEIYTMNADGTNQMNVTKNDSSETMSNLAWSPDGNKFLFSSNRGSGDDYEIYVANTDGTGVIQLTDNSSSDFAALWSPDGSHILFVSNRDENSGNASGFEIYIMNSDGTGLARLTDNSSYDTPAAWSPDGTEIAFITNRDGNYEIYKMSADGTGPVVNLTANSAVDVAAAWSPVQE